MPVADCRFCMKDVGLLMAKGAGTQIMPVCSINVHSKKLHMNVQHNYCMLHRHPNALVTSYAICTNLHASCMISSASDSSIFIAAITAIMQLLHHVAGWQPLAAIMLSYIHVIANCMHIQFAMLMVLM